MSGDNSIIQNRSKLKDFLASIATIRGDLSNITAPPFVLDTKSAVELPSFWAERPSVFVAAAQEENASKRALAVLRWFISSLRNQQYAGHEPEEGVKKPLNAFLGEVFLARWEDEAGLTRLVSEQVSHHPPVTACRVWNDDFGVYAEGFTRQEITFNGSVNIKQIGHATLRLSKHHNETYLIPLPSIKVSGIITGTPYPELGGTYHIPSTNGYVSTIDFSGKSFFSSSSKKHSFEATLYKEGAENKPLYRLSGNWDTEFTILDVDQDKIIETFDIPTAKSTPIQTEPLDQQDPWETRLAWRGVREALERGDMQGTSNAKNELENGQRAMRKEAGDDGKSFSRIFFRRVDDDPVAANLSGKIGKTINPGDTEGIWLFNLEAWQKGVQKPYHGDLRPDNSHGKSSSPNTGSATTLNTDHTQDVDTTHSTKMQASNQIENSASNGLDIQRPDSEPPTPNGDTDEVNFEGGVAGLSTREQSAVEDMLRDQYSSKDKK